MKNKMYTLLCVALVAQFGSVKSDTHPSTKMAPDMGEDGSLSHMPFYTSSIPQMENIQDTNDIQDANMDILKELPFHDSDIEYASTSRDDDDVSAQDEGLPLTAYMKIADKSLGNIAMSLGVEANILRMLQAERGKQKNQHLKKIEDRLHVYESSLESLGQEIKEKSYDYDYFFKKLGSFLQRLKSKYPKVYKDLRSKYSNIISMVTRENQVIHMPELETESYDPNDTTRV